MALRLYTCMCLGASYAREPLLHRQSLRPSSLARNKQRFPPTNPAHHPPTDLPIVHAPPFAFPPGRSLSTMVARSGVAALLAVAARWRGGGLGGKVSAVDLFGSVELLWEFLRLTSVIEKVSKSFVYVQGSDVRRRPREGWVLYDHIFAIPLSYIAMKTFIYVWVGLTRHGWGTVGVSLRSANAPLYETKNAIIVR